MIESLDDLEKVVVDLFMAVQNKNVTSPCWNEHPFTEEEKKICAYVVPIKDVRNLNIVFPTPDLLEFYKSSVSFKITALFIIKNQYYYTMDTTKQINKCHTMSPLYGNHFLQLFSPHKQRFNCTLASLHVMTVPSL